ncbi:MAG: hypothetical protein PHF31_03545 [Methylobacter sp.]|nr:hypothetical protein [Methylobacter sp.]
MKIYSSSLAFSPIGFNQQIGKSDSAQNKSGKDGLLVSKGSKNKRLDRVLFLASAPDEIKKTLNNTDLGLDSTKQVNHINLLDSKTSRALPAYSRELNSPLQDQRTHLITGIDNYA